MRCNCVQWRTVFFIAAAVYGVGSVVYLLAASGNKQPWAKHSSDDRVFLTVAVTGAVTIAAVIAVSLRVALETQTS